MGAIGNGLELLQMTSGEGTEELSLINDSLRSGLSKVRFFRISFGTAESETDVKVEELSGITDAMYGGRLRVGWDAGVPRISRQLARILFLAILCVEKSLPMGGNIQITVGLDNVEFEVVGRRTAPHSELWDLVTGAGPAPEVRSDNVQFPLLKQRLDETATTLTVNIGNEDITLSISIPATEHV